MTHFARASALTALLVALSACGGEPAEEPGAEAEPGAAEAVDTLPPAGAPAGPGGEAGAPASGQAVYTANCATCHGQGGRGDGPAAVGLEPPPADLTDGQWVTGDGSLAAIVNTIENGSPGTAMIAWKGTLTEAQIEAVARYVQSLGR